MFKHNLRKTLQGLAEEVTAWVFVLCLVAFALLLFYGVGWVLSTMGRSFPVLAEWTVKVLAVVVGLFFWLIGVLVLRPMLGVLAVLIALTLTVLPLMFVADTILRLVGRRYPAATAWAERISRPTSKERSRPSSLRENIVYAVGFVIIGNAACSLLEYLFQVDLSSMDLYLRR